MKRFLSFMFIFFIYIGISLGQNTGSAIQFDGINDYVAIPEGLIQSTDHTYSVEVWINVNVLSNAWTGIVHHSAVGGEFILEIDPDNNFEFGVHTPTGGGFGTWYKTKSPATVNQWYHIVGVRDGTVMRIYVDGDLKDTLSIADADQFILPNYHSCIGAYNREGNYLNGQVDEVRFWNVALTQIQIQSNMNNLLAGTEEGLAAYWCFDEGSGTTTTDLTANGYIGTLMNDPTWVASTAPVIYPTINTPPAAPQNLT
ncbi:MAG: LamG domain-containing protein, partial [Candidatus Neomarinimicrobiota bacterium]